MTTLEVHGAPQGRELRYRPDVDGLRAIAVLAVVFYHYGIPGFGGGYVGVDVFFVISGYLITSIIYGQMQAERFSLLNFYLRRVRRIFPALFAMLVVATLTAAWLFFPADFRRYGHSLLATALFSTNFEFVGQIGYFKVASIQRPLLHLWSVAVEEQFYLLFPALLLVAHTHSRRWITLIIGGLLAVSFAFAVWAVRHEPGWAFYLLPSRMWELMVGGLLAVSGVRAPENRFVREGLGLAGVALIGWGIFTFTKATSFPGANALFPCIGAALAIYAGSGGKTLVSRALSVRPVVFVGLISYSLYLWHWPIYVYAHYALSGVVTPLATTACFVLAVGLAIFSWQFIEKPFRHGHSAVHGGRMAFAAAAATIAVTLLTATSVVASRGFPERFAPPVQRILAEEHDDDGMLRECFGLPLKDINTNRLCRFGASKNIAVSFLLWGDSHADAILPAVRDVAAKSGHEGFFAGEPSCAPLLGVSRPDTPHCKVFNNRVLALLKKHPEIKTVILMARWGKNADGTAYGDEGHGFVPIFDKQGSSHEPSDNAAIFNRGLKRTVDALRAMHRQVVLVGPVPEIGWTVPRMLARQRLSGAVRRRPPSRAEYMHRQRDVLPLFKKLASKDGVSAIYPHKYLCSGERCDVADNGIPLYRDEHHLSVYGAEKIEPLFAHIF